MDRLVEAQWSGHRAQLPTFRLSVDLDILQSVVLQLHPHDLQSTPPLQRVFAIANFYSLAQNGRHPRRGNSICNP